MLRRALFAAACIGVFLFVVGSTPSQAEQKTRIVVLPPSLISAEESNLTTAVRLSLEEVLARHSQFEFVSSADVFTALSKWGNYSEDNAPSIAQSLNADQVLFSTLLKFGEQISLNVRVWNRVGGKSTPLRALSGRNMEDLQAAIGENFYDNFLVAAGQGKIVAAVTVSGNVKIGTPAIMQRIKNLPGNMYSTEGVSDDIKAIFGMGFFDDVTVEAQQTDAGVVLTYAVKEKPVINDIHVKGNKEIDAKQIRSLLAVKQFGVFNPGQTAKDAEKIKQFYRSKGFFNVEISSSLEEHDENATSANLTIDISEGDKLYITNIVFRGNAAMSTDDLREEIQTKERNFFSFVTDRGILKEDVLQQDVMRVEAFYMSNGFVNVKVSAPQVKYTKEGIDVVIEVQEGRRYRVGNVTLAGDKLKGSPEGIIEGRLSLPQKEFFDQSALVRDREQLLRLAQDEGFAFANVLVSNVNNDDKQTIDLTYTMVNGPPVYFGRIGVTGNTVTREKVILRSLAFSEGELFSRSKLEASHRSLNSLGFFGEVSLNPERGSKNDITDIKIQVKEKLTGVVSAGIGYSASEHAAITAQISKSNLFGYGQQINLQGSLSKTTAKFSFSFVDPYLFDYNIWSRFEAWNLLTQYDQYNLDSRGVAATFSRTIAYDISGSISYRLSADDVMDVKQNASQAIKNQAGRKVKSSVTLGLSKESIDNYLFPTRGYAINTYFTYAGIGGDIKFNKYTLSARHYEPITENLVLSLYGTVGFIEELEKGALPTYERFTLGGIGSLTGLNEIGPRDPATNDLIGGKTMMCYIVETVFPLVKDAGLMGAVFYNTGNAWERGFRFDDMRHTMGYGIRWNSPIGPIRLEWGYPLDRRNGEPSYRMEFSLGMRF